MPSGNNRNKEAPAIAPTLPRTLNIIIQPSSIGFFSQALSHYLPASPTEGREWAEH
jgi:hypothetical protein